MGMKKVAATSLLISLVVVGGVFATLKIKENNMNEQNQQGFVPSAEDVRGLMDWFAAYDALVQRNAVEEMANEAIFPNVVFTDDSQGEYVTQNWNREMFKQAMDLSAQGINPADIKIENTRNPIFLDKDLAVVITDSTISTGPEMRKTRYADIMVKKGGKWKFQAMVQAGWGDMLKQYMGYETEE